MEQEKKKRVRKKAAQIDSIEKLRKSDSKPKQRTRTKKTTDDPVRKGLSQSHISYGRFNVTIKQAPHMTREQLIEYYDKKFGIDDSDKSAKVIIQESSDVPIPEPMTEEEYRSGALKKKEPVKTTQREIHKVLSNFIDGIEQTWPKETDVHCWHCSYQFEGSPIPCPIDYDDVRKRYRVNGIFCSWGCMAKYSIEKYSSLAIVNQFRNEILGSEDGEIPIALPRFCLEKFGGPMKIEKFRSRDNKDFMISTEDISYVNQEIIELKHG